MELLKKIYKRGFLYSLLILFCLVGAFAAGVYEAEFSTFLFLTTLGFSILYPLIIYKIDITGEKGNETSKLLREEFFVTFLFISLSLTAVIESSVINMWITVFFAEFLGFSLLYFLRLVRVRKNFNGALRWLEQLSNSKIIFWFLIISVAILIIVLTVYEFEPFVNLLALIYFIVLFALGVRWLVQQIKLVIKLKNEKTKTELNHLQSQINPHFFFNMLNSLYGFVEQNPQKAKMLILKLSDMMRYSIYEGQQEHVTIRAEIEYLKNFVSLQQMRYHKKINVSFDLSIQEKELLVKPLLFIILVENAFKHGVEQLLDNAFVHITLNVEDDQIQFEVENNFDEEELPKYPGIGLKNLSRRLALIYPDKHKYSFSYNRDVYRSRLYLDLS